MGQYSPSSLPVEAVESYYPSGIRKFPPSKLCSSSTAPWELFEAIDYHHHWFMYIAVIRERFAG